MYYPLFKSNLVEKILNGLQEPTWQNVINTENRDYFQRTTEYGIEFEMFVPGLTKKDVKVELEGNKLFIHAKYESELTSYEISKTFTIGETIDSKHILASVENGILKVSFPYIKKEDKQKNRIQIL
jgi:HSP20 family molecular chaperone IbpA